MTTFRCVDLETTGNPEQDGEVHAIVETGFCDVVVDGDGRGAVSDPTGTLVDPGRSIPIPARAVHHISDSMVAGAIKPTAACMALMAEPRPDYFVAHNVDFEKRFFSGADVPWICTYKTALRLWPDAPGHKLQELRYELKVDDEPDFRWTLAAVPHRAPDDAYVCAFVLRKIIAAEPDLAKLARWSSGPALLYMCFMKKHRNKPWSQVAREDRDYLEWIYNKSDVKDRDILATVKYWLRQTAPPQTNPPDASY